MKIDHPTVVPEENQTVPSIPRDELGDYDPQAECEYCGRKMVFHELHGGEAIMMCLAWAREEA